MNSLQRIQDYINAELQVIAQEDAEVRAQEQLELIREEEEAMYEELYRRYRYDFDDESGPWWWEVK